MTRTQVLQEIRQMRFAEAYGGWQERRLTQEEAARLLGVCERTFRRYVDRYEDEGLDGLVDKRLSEVSARRAPVDEVLRTEALYRERNDGWNVKHFYSFYRRQHWGHRVAAWAILRDVRGVLAQSPEALRIAACGAEERRGDRPPAFVGRRRPAAGFRVRHPRFHDRTVASGDACAAWARHVHGRHLVLPGC